MVKKLMTLNELEFGNEKVEMERFDIVALIQNYLQASELLCRQKEIEVIMEAQNPVYVWADEFMVEEVFGNYFSNALNHIAGKRVIDVKLNRHDNLVRVSVFNTGEQIPEDSLPISGINFTKLISKNESLRRKWRWPSIVKAVMEALNQEYGAVNYDNGVEFWFELESAGEKVDDEKGMNTEESQNG